MGCVIRRSDTVRTVVYQVGTECGCHIFVISLWLEIVTLVPSLQMVQRTCRQVQGCAQAS
jgi:hypothetical protein